MQDGGEGHSSRDPGYNRSYDDAGQTTTAAVLYTLCGNAEGNAARDRIAVEAPEQLAAMMGESRDAARVEAAEIGENPMLIRRLHSLDVPAAAFTSPVPPEAAASASTAASAPQPASVPQATPGAKQAAINDAFLKSLTEATYRHSRRTVAEDGMHQSILENARKLCTMKGSPSSSCAPGIPCCAHAVRVLHTDTMQLLCPDHDRAYSLLNPKADSRVVLVEIPSGASSASATPPAPVLRVLGPNTFINTSKIGSANVDSCSVSEDALEHDVVCALPLLLTTKDACKTCGSLLARPHAWKKVKGATGVITVRRPYNGSYIGGEVTEVVCVHCASSGNEVRRSLGAEDTPLSHVGAAIIPSLSKRPGYGLRAADVDEHGIRHANSLYGHPVEEFVRLLEDGNTTLVATTFTMMMLVCRLFNALLIPALRGMTSPCLVCKGGVRHYYIDACMKAFRYCVGGPTVEPQLGVNDVMLRTDDVRKCRDALHGNKNYQPDRGGSFCGISRWLAAAELVAKDLWRAVSGIMVGNCSHRSIFFVAPMVAHEDKVTQFMGLLLAIASGPDVFFMDCGCQLLQWIKKWTDRDPGIFDASSDVFFPGVKPGFSFGAPGEPFSVADRTRSFLLSSPPPSSSSSSSSSSASSSSPSSLVPGPAPASSAHQEPPASYHTHLQASGFLNERTEMSIALPSMHAFGHVNSCAFQYASTNVEGAGLGPESSEQVFYQFASKHRQARNMTASNYYMYWMCGAAEHNARKNRELPRSLLRSAVTAREKVLEAQKLLALTWEGYCATANLQAGGINDSNLRALAEARIRDRKKPGDDADAGAESAAKRRALHEEARKLEAQAAALERLVNEVEALPNEKDRLAAFLTGRDASQDVRDALKGRTSLAGSIDGAKTRIADLRRRAAGLRGGEGPMYDPDAVFTERMVRLRANAKSIRRYHVMLCHERIASGLKPDTIIARLTRLRNEAAETVDFLRALHPDLKDAEAKKWVAENLHPNFERELHVVELPSKLGALTFAPGGTDVDGVADAWQGLLRARETFQYAVEDVTKALENLDKCIADQEARLRDSLKGDPGSLVFASGMSGLLTAGPAARLFGLDINAEGTTALRPGAFVAKHIYAGLLDMRQQRASLARVQAGVQRLARVKPDVPVKKDALGRSVLLRDSGRLLRGELRGDGGEEWVRRGFGKHAGSSSDAQAAPDRTPLEAKEEEVSDDESDGDEDDGDEDDGDEEDGDEEDLGEEDAMEEGEDSPHTTRGLGAMFMNAVHALLSALGSEPADSDSPPPSRDGE